MSESITRAWLPRWFYEVLELGYSVLEFAKLGVAVLSYRPDALYERCNIFMLSGVWVARCFRLPFLVEVNSPLAQERSIYGGLALRQVAEWTEHHIWRSASCVLPVSQVLANEITVAGVAPSRISVIPNGVDPRRFVAEDGSARRATVGPRDDLVLGFVGFVRSWHRLDQIIDLMAADPVLSAAHLLIVGDGPACAELRRLSETLGLRHRLTITGIVNPEDIPGLLDRVDIALQPEVTSYASPLKLFEYMAAGCAILAPDRPNIREILEHGSDALLFTPGDFESVSNSLRRLALDRELRHRLGRAAARKITERGLTWEANARRVAAIVQELRS